jgi:hypothetical protein
MVLATLRTVGKLTASVLEHAASNPEQSSTAAKDWKERRILFVSYINFMVVFLVQPFASMAAPILSLFRA